MSSCLKSLPNGGGVYVPIPTAAVKYPTEMYYGTQQPDKTYQVVQDLSISEENPLGYSQRVNEGRMLKRGNDEDAKQLLYAKLSLQAKELGADGLINITYKVFTGMKSDGFEIRATAVKFDKTKKP